MSDPEEVGNGERDLVERLAELPTMAHPTVSPDRSEVALYYDVTERNELHVLNSKTRELHQWSDGEVPRDARWFVDWAADGDRVFFHLDEHGDEQNDLYAIDRDGRVEPIVEMDGQVFLADVGENGTHLLVGSNRDGQMNLFRHDLASGETTKITDYERAVYVGHLSPDGERVAYATNETDVYENQDVYVAGVDGSDPRNLEIGETGAEATPADWHPDGDALLVGDNTVNLGRCGVYDLETDEVAWFGGGQFDETPQFFLSDGNQFVAVREREASTVPVVYDVVTGESEEFALPDGVVNFGWGAGDYILEDGRILLSFSTPTRRSELLAYDIETHDYETIVEAEYGELSPEDFADADYFTVRSDGIPDTPADAVDHDPYDELEIGAILYDSGHRPSPLLVHPHGGPRARSTKQFDLYAQFLVSRGFSVLQVNYRGSSGRGREFVERLYDDWGGAEQGDVATAAEHVIDEYPIDESRVVVFGGSYGGYSAYWQMVQYPDLYDAGVAWIGISDLSDMYENTMSHFRTELMEKYLGTPEDNPGLYEERSPTTHAANLSAPLLILHGVNDRRVPVSQARLFREALEEHGFEAGEDADFEYRELGEEGHASTDIDQKARTFHLLDEFFERRIGTDASAVGDATSTSED
ncbi:S9 family peptidase [Salinigranum salinum]|uniref:S9 family peptidase n=1 Tax=Salinigranum salinum TaxID=1364937 RepID=UPI001260659D